MGIKLQHSSIAYLQIVGRIEAMNLILGNLLHYFVSKNIQNFAQAEFVYNKLPIQTTYRSLFEVMHNCNPTTYIELIPKSSTLELITNAIKKNLEISRSYAHRFVIELISKSLAIRNEQTS